MLGKKIYWIIALLVIALLGAILYNKATHKDALKVAIENVQLHTIIQTVTASGKIYPSTEIKISPDVSGEITELYVQEGQEVRKGQLLATINASNYTTSVTRANAQLSQQKTAVSNASALSQQAKAQLEQATKTYERNLSLYKDKVISAVEFEQAEGAYKTAKANFTAMQETIKGNTYGVQSAEANVHDAMQSLRKTAIYCPMNGIVSKLFVKKGERVVGTMQMAGTEIMRVADMSVMKVDIDVSENDIQKVKIGDSAIIKVDAYSDKIFKGLVSKIAQSSTNTGQVQLTDQITNYTVSITILAESYWMLLQENPTLHPFRPGMSASVDVLTKYEYNVLAVPINAVTTREEEDSIVLDKNEKIKEYVFVVDKTNKAKQVLVTTGIQDNNYIQILSGLQPAETIITAPYSAIARTLKDKKEVQIVDKKKLYQTDKKEKE